MSDSSDRPIDRRSHSWRNFEPQEVIDFAHEESKYDGRVLLDYIEGGRFQPMLKAGYDFFIQLDPDERRAFADRNQDFVDWLGAFAFCEGLNRISRDVTVEYPDR